MPSTSLTGDPNTCPFSRPSLVAHGRESGLPLVNHLRNIGSPPKLPRQFENQGLLSFTICDPLSVPSLRMEDGSMVTFLSYYVLSLLLSSSTSESDGLLSSPQRVIRCGILCSPVFSLCSSPCISPPVSLTRYGMVGTVAGDGAPRSLSDFRSSGVCWTRPFSFSDSSLDGLRPFWLLLFHPALPFFCFLGLAVLADASTAFAIVSHQLFSLGHNWHYSPLVGLLANSLLYAPKNSHIPPPPSPSCNASGPVVSHACSRRCHH